MSNRKLRRCHGCLAVSVLLVAVSAGALANTPDAATTAPANGPSWAWIASLAFSACATLASALAVGFQKGVERRFDLHDTALNTLATSVSTLERMVLTKYHNDDEIASMLSPIQAQLESQGRVMHGMEKELMALHVRFDVAGIGGTRSAPFTRGSQPGHSM